MHPWHKIISAESFCDSFFREKLTIFWLTFCDPQEILHLSETRTHSRLFESLKEHVLLFSILNLSSTVNNLSLIKTILVSSCCSIGADDFERASFSSIAHQVINFPSIPKLSPSRPKTVSAILVLMTDLFLTLMKISF